MNTAELQYQVDSPPKLISRLSWWMKALVDRPHEVKKLLSCYSSPLNLFMLDEFSKNIENLTLPFVDYGVSHKFFFARKANRLPCFVTAARNYGVGVDVASYEELNETLSLGAEPKDVVVTAIAKDERIIDRALSCDAVIVVDCFDELSLVLSRSKELGLSGRIGIRFCDFKGLESACYSRFGFKLSERYEVLRLLDENKDYIQEIPFIHTHLDKYSVKDRVTAGFSLLEGVREFRLAGYKVNGINLGGGIPMSYAASQEVWNSFKEAMHKAVLKKRKPFTFAKTTFGLRQNDAKVEGELSVYPAWGDEVKGDFIRKILTSTDENRRTFAETLKKEKVTLYFEPGRSLLDNCGCTLSELAFRKSDTENNVLLGLRMNNTQLTPFREELPIEPIHIPIRETLNQQKDVEVYLVGNMCAESDFILKRKTILPTMPAVGDVFLFPNTAGYFMHHKEKGAHGNPLAKNVVLNSNNLMPLCEVL